MIDFSLAIVKAHDYVYIVNDMQRVTANEKTGFHPTVGMNKL